MKIQLLSDLHLEFEAFDYQATDADVVVLAGDIHVGEKGVDWALQTIPDKPILYVMGNHEFYGETIQKLLARLNAKTQGTHLHILERDVVTLEGVNFLGCTLWTDFELFGDPRHAGHHCQQVMTDYKKIRHLPNYSKIRTIDTAVIHKQSHWWLEQELQKRSGQTNVVITHHAPSVQSIPENSRSDLTTAAYASRLESFIERYQPALWLHGHVHHASDYKIGNCSVICNPRGYPGAWVKGFQPEGLIEIAEPAGMTLENLLGGSPPSSFEQTEEDVAWLSDKPIGGEEI